ncbi:cyclin binding protein [Kwoniella heveanensis CBS 569]|uniref:Cyclin binding protein n=1 Tax=Kwoniella heveanensis BCC8398 TaxID=1296120 RepID=A0A1B9H1K7_9TREE|nr:cyclin binding protein [Kwoniella heveanensis BCC8398]OCF46056.1 cyclin binding protein [Kwoniella heveanensis CBS 569]
MPKHNQPLQIRLTEPVIFLKGPSTGLDFRGRPQAVRQDGQPAMVRGLLTLRLNKPTRIRSIAIKLEGKARTEWPEGIGSKRMDTSEEHVILCDQTTYFSAYQHDDESRSTSARRARSVGPGISGNGHEDEDIDDDMDLPGVPRETDDPDDFLSMERRGREGAGTRRTAMMRSSSAMPGTHDNHSWHRDGFSRRPSFSDLDSPTSSFNLGNLNIQDRGPSPAYTPHASPPRTSIPLPGGQPSRPSSLRQSNTGMQPSSREPALSPIASAAPSQSASERGDSAEAEHRRPTHTLRSALSSEAVQEGAIWSPSIAAAAELSNQSPSDSAVQDDDNEEEEEPSGNTTPLRPILQPRSLHMSSGTGEVRFQDPVDQSSEMKDPATDRRQSVDGGNENENDEDATPPTAPADASVPPPSPAPVIPSSHADPTEAAPAQSATASAGNRAASIRTYNSTHSTSSASISLHSDPEPTRETHPTGVQAVSVANTAHNSPVSSAPPSIRNRSSTETLGNTGRASGTDGSSPSGSRRTSVLSNSHRQSSELSMTNLASQPSQENLPVTRQGRTTRLGSTSTIVENTPGPLTNGSQSNIPSSLRTQPRSQRSASGTPSIASGHIPSVGAGARNQSVSNLRASSSSRRDSSEDGRGRKSSKFSLAATLRGISRDVKETFHHGRHASKSRSRMSSPVRADSFNSERPTPSMNSSSQSITTSSMARTGSGTGVNDTIRRPASRNPSYAQEDFHPSYGRGGAGSRRSRSRERNSSTIGFRDRDGEERSRSRARGRHKGMKVLTDKLGLGEHEEHQGEDVHNWKEFRKGEYHSSCTDAFLGPWLIDADDTLIAGTYNYPISFPIPVNAPPTIHAEFGSVTYRLKATVIRVGALTPNLSEDTEVVMIATPQEDDMEETENVIVERQWEEQMRYQITLGGKAFPIAGTIPISIRLMPLLKCKIHRLTVALEEKTDYFAQERKVARHETPKRFVLLFIKQPDHKERIEPLLPIISDDPLAAEQSPVAEMARQAVLNNPLPTDLFDLERDPNDSMYASLMEPTGPWHLEKELHIPDCASKIKFTTKHEQTNITVGHWLKVTIRVERGDDEALDAKGRRKQFDIIIETPIKILDCRVNPQWNSLPTYSVVSRNISSVPGICSVHGSKSGATSGQSRSGVPVQDSHISSASLIGATVGNTSDTPPSFGVDPHAGPSRRGTMDAGSSSGGGGFDLGPLHIHPHSHHNSFSSTTNTNQSPHPAAVQPVSTPPAMQESGQDTLLDRNIVYDRLMSGQVTETGEVPPSYGEALAAAEAARSRSVSRVRDMDEPVMMGRGRSEGGRSRSRLRE